MKCCNDPLFSRFSRLAATLLFFYVWSTTTTHAFVLLPRTRVVSTPSSSSIITRHVTNEYELLSVISVQEALVSPTKARTIRKHKTRRQARGKLLVPVTSQKTSSRNNNSVVVTTKTALNPTNSSKRRTDEKDEKQASKVPKRKTIKREKGMHLSYTVTMQALRAYHAQHGDLVMPRRYIVPDHDEAYPPEWRGRDLSSTVYNMKWWQDHIKQRSERVVELSKLGFCWQRLQPEWNIVLEALITYSSLYGDVLVPHKFVVPHADENWPKATWNISLGNIVYRIRARNDFLRDPHSAASRRDQLDGLGFVWDVPEYRFKKFYVALRIFTHLQGCGEYRHERIQPLNVPSNFVVPETEQWPQDLWGYPLGAKCTAVRQKQIYIKNHPERQALLHDLGFHWSGNADLGWLKVVHAAAIYSRLNQRRLDVPYSFKVPSRPENYAEDWPWPEYLWGMPLGQRLKDVRTKGAYLHGELADKRKRQLDALGFNWTPKTGRPRKPRVSK